MALKFRPSKIVFFLAAIAWVLIISSFSTTSFGANKTAPLIEYYLHKIFPSLNISTIHFIHVLIRKLAHFSEFGIFAALVFGAWAANESRWSLKWLFYSSFLVTSLALLDEYHQSFVRNRNASLGDSLIDFAGGVTFLLIIWIAKRAKFTLSNFTQSN